MGFCRGGPSPRPSVRIMALMVSSIFAQACTPWQRFLTIFWANRPGSVCLTNLCGHAKKMSGKCVGYAAKCLTNLRATLRRFDGLLQRRPDPRIWPWRCRGWKSSTSNGFQLSLRSGGCGWIPESGPGGAESRNHRFQRMFIGYIWVSGGMRPDPRIWPWRRRGPKS